MQTFTMIEAHFEPLRFVIEVDDSSTQLNNLLKTQGKLFRLALNTTHKEDGSRRFEVILEPEAMTATIDESIS